jgi:hypothetical protein
MGTRAIRVALLILDLGAKWGCVVNAAPQPLYPPGKAPVPNVEEVGRAPGPVWTAIGKTKPRALTAVRTPHRPARRVSLYRLRYPGVYILT